MGIILASASPRRQEILEQIGCPFFVIVSDAEEINDSTLAPNVVAVRNAVAKASAVLGKVNHNDVVIGADTIVVLDGTLFGKPSDEKEAANMLRLLSGRCHQVITGIAVIATGEIYTDYVETQVYMRSLSDSEIASYISSGEPLDKAGGYAIQGKGALFIEKINGCYSNVVGLPINKVANILKKVGVHLS